MILLKHLCVSFHLFNDTSLGLFRVHTNTPIAIERLRRSACTESKQYM